MFRPFHLLCELFQFAKLYETDARHVRLYIHTITYIQLKFDSAALTKVKSSDALQ